MQTLGVAKMLRKSIRDAAPLREKMKNYRFVPNIVQPFVMIDRLQQLTDFLIENPDDPFLKYAIATEHLKLGHTEEALRYYEGLIANHPGYVGTYYHLGKLYEALNRRDDAITVYEKGMHSARAKRDMHALSELQAAYRAATGMDDDDDDE